MKKCSICSNIKELSKFVKQKTVKSGYSSKCKECAKNISIDYRRTLIGHLTVLYHSQLNHSKKRNHPNPSYSLEELKNKYIDDVEYITLYNYWANNNFEKNLSPSFDRIDSSLPYTFDNIQLMPWWMNCMKGASDQFRSIIKVRHKSVRQYSLSGVLIRTHKSIASAARRTLSSRTGINNCVKGLSNSSNGFIWEYN